MEPRPDRCRTSRTTLNQPTEHLSKSTGWINPIFTNRWVHSLRSKGHRGLATCQHEFEQHSRVVLRGLPYFPVAKSASCPLSDFLPLGGGEPDCLNSRTTNSSICE